MITDDNEKIKVGEVYYYVWEVRTIILGIQRGCSLECLPLLELQRIERLRRNEMELANGVNNEQKRIEQLERKSDD